jgi:hypothetical protein
MKGNLKGSLVDRSLKQRAWADEDCYEYNTGGKLTMAGLSVQLGQSLDEEEDDSRQRKSAMSFSRSSRLFSMSGNVNSSV